MARGSGCYPRSKGVWIMPCRGCRAEEQEVGYRTEGGVGWGCCCCLPSSKPRGRRLLFGGRQRAGVEGAGIQLLLELEPAERCQGGNCSRTRQRAGLRGMQGSTRALTQTLVQPHAPLPFLGTSFLDASPIERKLLPLSSVPSSLSSWS